MQTARSKSKLVYAAASPSRLHQLEAKLGFWLKISHPSSVFSLITVRCHGTHSALFKKLARFPHGKWIKEISKNTQYIFKVLSCCYYSKCTMLFTFKGPMARFQCCLKKDTRLKKKNMTGFFLGGGAFKNVSDV